MTMMISGSATTPAWVPTDITGCTFWVKSDTGVTKDGSDRVSQWNDQIAGNNLLQATDSKKFTYYANQLNSYPSLRSDGVDDYMQTGAFTIAARPTSRFLVYKNRTPGASGVKDCIQDGRTDYWIYLEDTSPQSAIYGGTYCFTGELFSNNVFTLTTMIIPTTGTPGRLRKNGVEKTITDGGPVASTPGGITLGSLPDGTRGTNIDFVEFIAYDSVLSAGNITLVEDYLNTRYVIY